MIKTKMITHQNLQELMRRLVSAGKLIIAPVEKDGKIIFDAISSLDGVARDYIQTRVSSKDAVFPRYEEILHYHFKDKEIILDDERKKRKPTVIFAARPCDARSLAVHDAVFTSDYIDEFYTQKKKFLTVISMSCAKCDEFCFCTSVGGGPADTAGSDILLTKIDDSKYYAEIATDAGWSLVAENSDLFTETEAIDKSSYIADVPQYFDKDDLVEKVSKSFDDDIYLEQSLRCIGCGACSYVCPTCTCFDIQDETMKDQGVRIRCWDSCGLGHFTLHTSWHNPRHVQSKRWRQRIMHKFYYQPDRLNVIGCVGCGRCSRVCPVDMNLLDHCKALVEKIS